MSANRTDLAQYCQADPNAFVNERVHRYGKGAQSPGFTIGTGNHAAVCKVSSVAILGGQDAKGLANPRAHMRGVPDEITRIIVKAMVDEDVKDFVGFQVVKAASRNYFLPGPMLRTVNFAFAHKECYPVCMAMLAKAAEDLAAKGTEFEINLLGYNVTFKIPLMPAMWDCYWGDAREALQAREIVAAEKGDAEIAAALAGAIFGPGGGVVTFGMGLQHKQK